MRSPLVLIVALFALAVTAFTLAGCATSEAPQTQRESGDLTRLTVSVNVSAFNLTPSPATTQPSHDPGGYHIERASVTTLTSSNVTNAGTSTSGLTSTAGNPTNNNTPDIRPSVPINVTPGSGTVLGGGR